MINVRVGACLATALLALQVAHARNDADVPAATSAAGLHLQPTRRVEFETDEGTWLSLDVAPDGKTLVFELLGDIYTMEAAGGAARLLLGGMAFESQPVYSPDGARIAFLSDRSGNENLWIANTDGSNARQLSFDDDDTSFASPAWSPDGDYVYVARSAPEQDLGAYAIWMYHLQGGSGVRITRAEEGDHGADSKGMRMHLHERRAVSESAAVNAIGPAPSPDGRYLFYSTRKGGYEQNLDFPLWQIARRDLIAGTEDIIISAPGSAMRPVISPDGDQVVYATRLDGETELRLRHLDTGEDRRLAYPVQRDAQEEVPSRDLMPGCDFTPDGRALIVSYGGKIRRVELASGESRVIPFTAKVALDIGPELRVDQRVSTGAVRARVLQTPRQSPDGRRLVFSALARLYTMDLPSGTPRRLTSATGAEFHPTWSPDGRWIAYVTWGARGGHLWKIPVNGRGKPQQLTQVPGYYSDPVFSPDGKTLFALRSSNYARMHVQEEITPVRVADIIRVPASGGKPALVSHAVGARGPHFSRDPQRIYFYADDGLQSVRLDGIDRRTHARIKAPGSLSDPKSVAVTELSLSPDGKWALAQLASQLYVVAVPQTGDANLEIDLASSATPSKRLTDVGADYFAWADGGKTITWALGSTFYRRPISSITFDRPTEAEGEGAKTTEPPKQATADAGAALTESFTALVEVPRDVPRGAVVLRGATVITMKGDEVIENADVAIVDNRIAAAGRRGEIDIPAGAQLRDVSGKYIVPGFVDTHAHWYEIRHGLLDLENWSFMMNLAYGVTAGLDVQAFTSDMFVYEDMIDAGLMIGPRAYSTGRGVFSDSRIQSAQDARNVLTRYRDFYGTRNIKSYVVGNRRQRQLVVAAAKELGIMPTTEGAVSFKLDLTHAIDGFAGNEHALPSVPLHKDVVELFARTRIGYTIASMVAYGGPYAEDYFFIHQSPHHDPKVNRFMPHFVNDTRTRRRAWYRDEDQIFPKLATEAAKIQRAGGLIGVGSHAEFQGLAYHWEMQVLAGGGLTPREVLRAATVQGSEIIGRAADLGSIEPGKLADLVVLEKNPLEDIRNSLAIELVMKSGRLYDADTLDEVWPRQRPLPAPWFREE